MAQFTPTATLTLTQLATQCEQALGERLSGWSAQRSELEWTRTDAGHWCALPLSLARRRSARRHPSDHTAGLLWPSTWANRKRRATDHAEQPRREWQRRVVSERRVTPTLAHVADGAAVSVPVASPHSGRGALLTGSARPLSARPHGIQGGLTTPARPHYRSSY